LSTIRIISERSDQPNYMNFLLTSQHRRQNALLYDSPLSEVFTEGFYVRSAFELGREHIGNKVFERLNSPLVWHGDERGSSGSQYPKTPTAHEQFGHKHLSPDSAV
jgi:hypothetical protein